MFCRSILVGEKRSSFRKRKEKLVSPRTLIRPFKMGNFSWDLNLCISKLLFRSWREEREEIVRSLRAWGEKLRGGWSPKVSLGGVPLLGDAFHEKKWVFPYRRSKKKRISENPDLDQRNATHFTFFKPDLFMCCFWIITSSLIPYPSSFPSSRNRLSSSDEEDSKPKSTAFLSRRGANCQPEEAVPQFLTQATLLILLAQ